jgi:hypothetical protein
MNGPRSISFHGRFASRPGRARQPFQALRSRGEAIEAMLRRNDDAVCRQGMFTQTASDPARAMSR